MDDRVRDASPRLHDLRHALWPHAKGEIKPQLVDTYTASPDNLHYSFTLREGLKFSDGTPLTTKDVIASIKRWGARDNLGAKLLAAAEKLEAKDDRTFTLDFKSPSAWCSMLSPNPRPFRFL